MNIHAPGVIAPGEMNVSLGNRVLAVDDDEISLTFLHHQLLELGYDVMTAASGQQGLEELDRHGATIDVVLLDRIMPGIDGIAMAEEMRRNDNLRHIPIIMQTGADRTEEVREGIEAGVFYYLTKPVDELLLRSVLSSAMRESTRRRSLSIDLATQSTSFRMMQSCRFNVRTPAEAETVACFAANCFSDPERVLLGLTELLINAVEHGNLELGYEAKSQLVAAGEWASEIERRLDSKNYGLRTVDVALARKNGGVYVSITDQGKGFDWQRYLQIDPARASDSHGRGIAQARAVAFDKLTYNETGNKVVAYLSDEPKLDW